MKPKPYPPKQRAQLGTLKILLMLQTSNQGNLIQGKAQLALKNWKNLFGDQREDSLTSLEVCNLL